MCFFLDFFLLCQKGLCSKNEKLLFKKNYHTGTRHTQILCPSPILPKVLFFQRSSCFNHHPHHTDRFTSTWGFEMANLDHLEVMARLTCQALRVFAWWKGWWVPHNGHGEIWICCVVVVICFKVVWIILLILMMIWQFESDFRGGQGHHMVIM